LWLEIAKWLLFFGGSCRHEFKIKKSRQKLGIFLANSGASLITVTVAAPTPIADQLFANPTPFSHE
jgi:hypothetical protein